METNKRKKRRIIILILLLLIIIAIGLSITLCDHFANDGRLHTNEVEKEKNSGTISVPGFEGVTLKAGTKKQNIAFENPERNNCYFVMSLILEDGTLLWESNYVKPGKTSKAVVLNEELEKGVYSNTTLKYDCFRLEDKKPMDRVETKLTLWVE